jgi:pimeloyl-ACP methyl ester carboxylesterase
MKDSPRIAVETASMTRTRFIQSHGRTLAYRSLGSGPPLLLCLRLRGVMDVWDPAFIDALARDFRVILFDYSGLGQSTGTPTYDRDSLARDALDIADGLGLDKVVIAGWSLGAMAALAFAANYPDRTSHAVAIGGVPPGTVPQPPEEIFLPTALKPVYALEDELILFFEPASTASRVAGAKSRDRIAGRIEDDRSPPIPEAVYTAILAATHDPEASVPDKSGRYAKPFSEGRIPLLALCGDHDIVFPVENWYALNRRWRSLHIHTVPLAGHGPHHEHPELSADIIASFVRNVS